MNKLFGFHISKLQTMEGLEGYIARGRIMHGKTPVADFFNDGNGGSTDFHVIVPKGVFDELEGHLAKQYAKIGIEIRYMSPFEFLIDDYISIDGLRKEAKKVGKKRGWKETIVSLFSHKDEHLGFILDGVYGNAPCREGKFAGYGSAEAYYLGSFDASKDINVTCGVPA